MMSAGRKAKELISQYSYRCSLRRQKLRTARRLDWTGWAKRPPPCACRGLRWGAQQQIPQVLIVPAAVNQHTNVPVHRFHHSEAYLRAAVVHYTFEVFEQHVGQ